MTSDGALASASAAETAMGAMCRGTHDREAQELSARVMVDGVRAHARVVRDLQTRYRQPTSIDASLKPVMALPW